MHAVDGVHDLGGRQGFGPVEADGDEPTFAARWEGRAFGVAGAALMAGGFNTPMFRHAMERMDPAHYLTSSYYEHWLTGVATLLVEAGTVSRDDLEARVGRFPLSRGVTVTAEAVDVPDPGPARYAVGDRVRVRDVRFGGHTRCPGYVRRRTGTVVRVDPPAPVPEVEAHRRARVLEHSYGVRFAATELWGDAARPQDLVHVDLYESYLDPAEEARP
jgi:nitrile hydratase beta subunit